MTAAITDLFLSALCPEGVACFACGKERLLDSRGLCKACADALVYCPGVPQISSLSGVSCTLLYQGAAVSAIHRLKYHNAAWTAKPIAALMQIPAAWEIDCIVPVPLYPQKERARGYNQSALLAGWLAKYYDLPMEAALLARVRDTGSQARMPDKQARAENVRGAFAAAAADGMRILLIDDVCTTGSTLNAAAKALLSSGAKQVFALCACYRD